VTPVKRIAALAVAALAAGTAAACGGSAGSGPSTAASSKPVSGGTLRFVSASDFDHVDVLSAYAVPSFQLAGAWTRQLVSYWPSNDVFTATTIAPDVATTVPTRANGGISADGTTYTFHIRKGVMWDSKPARQVTSADFLRQFKAMCNPTLGVGNSLYYVPVIAGMTQYCNAYTAAFRNTASPTAAAEAGFQDTHAISGIGTPNSMTISFKLTQPANDFLNILAMPFASARPAEYDKYLPDSAVLRQHTLSDGPYAITSYTPTKKIVLSRNPAWKQSTDPIRHQYVSQIVVTEGTSSSATALAQIQAGSADLMWDLPVPTAQIPGLEASKNPGLHIYTNQGSENPYLVFNVQSPDANHAMSKLLVRQAIEYAINKVAVAKILGGTKLNPILNGAIAPGNTGYTNYNYYQTPNNQGDPARCRATLARAGYPHGFTLVYSYRNAGNHPALYTSMQSDLRACGISVRGAPQSQGTFYNFLSNGPNGKNPGQWDVAEAGWGPDWFGNNGRSSVVPLFETNCANPTSNYGCYSNATTDADIRNALTAPNEADAAPYWATAGQQVMKDAAIVPLVTPDIVLFAGPRVHHLVYNPLAAQYNVTQLWLSP
jgi:peptide/nickel transport system substrate-binding protein